METYAGAALDGLDLASAGQECLNEDSTRSGLGRFVDDATTARARDVNAGEALRKGGTGRCGGGGLIHGAHRGNWSRG